MSCGIAILAATKIRVQNGIHFQIYETIFAPLAIHSLTRNNGPSCPVTARMRLSSKPHWVTSIRWIDVKTIIEGNAQGMRKMASSERTHQLRLTKKPDNRKARNIMMFTPIATSISVLIAVVRYSGSENSTPYRDRSLPIHSPYMTG